MASCVSCPLLHLDIHQLPTCSSRSFGTKQPNKPWNASSWQRKPWGAAAMLFLPFVAMVHYYAHI